MLPMLINCAYSVSYPQILASASYDDTIRIYEEDASEDDWYCACTLTGHTSTVWSIDFDSTGSQLVSGSDDHSLRIWRRRSEEEEEEEENVDNNDNNRSKWICDQVIPDAHSRAIYSVCWSHSNGIIASAGSDNAIKLFQKQNDSDTSKSKFKQVLELPQAHDSDINCLIWIPDANGHSNMLASAGDDGVIKLWKLESIAMNGSQSPYWLTRLFKRERLEEIKHM